MSLRIKCHSCHAQLEVKDEAIHRPVHCPRCKTILKDHLSQHASPPSPSATSDRAAVVAVPSQAGAVTGVLGRFQIREVLGQGAFGTVYRAFDPILDREVALKTPRLGAHAAEKAERLMLEAKSAARLRHPNIVAVYEAGAAGDDLFVACELVEGQTLAQRLANHGELAEAVGWVRNLAEALAYAHQQGVVHRDVKPLNVMINANGRAQLMDFGLATREDVAETQTAKAEGRTVGTPAYMSPEQAAGDGATVGPQTDQYSLGVVLFELLTGRTPFVGSSTEILQQLRTTDPPRVQSILKHVPRDLAAVCEKALARKPEDRYRDCQAFADDLGRWLNGDLVRARRYSILELAQYWAKRNPSAFGWTAAAASLLLLFGGTGAVVGVQAWAANRAANQPRDAVSSLAGDERIASDANRASEPPADTSLNADNDLQAEVLRYGRLLDRARCAFHEHELIKADEYLEQTRWDFRDWEYAYLRRLITGGWRTFHGHRMAVTAVAFHPNGQRVASADGTVRVWNVVTGDEVTRLQHNAAVTGVAFSADGKQVITTEGLIEQTQPMFGPGGPMMMPAPVATPAPSASLKQPRSDAQGERSLALQSRA